tara:strand:- start:56 stop:826 length:771 start_codon:yes stop_codon:yes gene_type:complete
MKNQYIEEIYTTTDENHREIFTRLIHRLENRQIDIAEDYYWTNGSLPDDSIIFFKPEPQIHKQAPVKIGIESWNELELKIGLKEVVFQNIHTGNSFEMYLRKLKWEKNLCIDVLRILGSEPVLKHHHFIPDSKYAKIPEWQSIKNAVQKIKNQLRGLFPKLPDTAIEYNRQEKGYCTFIKITLLDSEEYLVNMNEDLQQKALGIIGTTSRNKPKYNDNIGEGVVLKKKKYRSNGDFMRKQDRAESIQSFIEENYIY